MFVFLALAAAAAILSLLRIVLRRPAWLGSGRDISRVALAITFMLTAATRLVSPDTMLEMIPVALPFRHGALYLSGFLEALGAVGLLVPRTRRAAGWGLAALLLAVFPANVNVALNNLQIDGYPGSAVYQWVRLPLQFVLIWLAVWVSRGDVPTGGHAERCAPRPAGARSGAEVRKEAAVS